MSMHLFSTPTECQQCGTVVDDPRAGRCPSCSALLRERRNPSRLAGVEKRYGGLRLLIGFLRFLGIIIFGVGILVFAFGVGDDASSMIQSALALLGAVLTAVAMLASGAFFEVILDMEENTRSAFHVQLEVLDGLQKDRAEEPSEAAPPVPQSAIPE
ncbi:MAG: hypothetical protein M3483_00180 [Gemmatimonadota bacterium]|nr:hypothetical protein [Gemmatimonadota bacterium]